jgi:hypothetical protein
MKSQRKGSPDPTTTPFAPRSNVSSTPSVVSDFSEYQKGFPSEPFGTINDLDLPKDDLKGTNEILLRMLQQERLDHDDLKFEYDRIVTPYRDKTGSLGLMTRQVAPLRTKRRKSGTPIEA